MFNWDILIEDLVISNHKPDWNYCDVGSCQGQFSKLFVNLATEGSVVYAFDINQNNPIISGCINERIAVSDIDGIENVYDGGSHMSSILSHDVVYNNIPCVSSIQSVRLDTYFKDKHIDCIKIDVEGAELKVLRGGIETIKRCSLIIIECHLDEDWEELYDLLDSNNMIFYELLTKEKITRDYTKGPRGIRPYQIYYESN
jgi:FkbM family methyltransferase